MKYFDLHCDTLGLCLKDRQGLKENKFHIALNRAAGFELYVQCYAAYIPDTYQGDAAFQYFEDMARVLYDEAAKGVVDKLDAPISLAACKNQFAGILTIENGNVLGGKLENIEKIAKMGVKMITLTWNGINEIGSGILTKKDSGLSAFGKKAIPEMERNNIVVDVSHASPGLFYDVAAIAEKPFVASHSNAKRICKHPRNLTDEQFAVIKKHNGLVGLNFYRAFLNDDPDKACIHDIITHAEHFLSLGGEDCLAFGSDFDGAEMPRDITGIESIAAIYEAFLKMNYNESLIQKIFFENAANFFVNNNLL